MGLMMYRRGIEVSAARLAAINATDEDIAALESYFKDINGTEVNNHEFAQATTEFHKHIAKASKNALLEQTLEIIGWVITTTMADFLTYTSDVTDSSYYHYMIFRCIKQRKQEEAAYMMDRHMEYLIERVKDYMRYKALQHNEVPDSNLEVMVQNTQKNE